MKRKDALWVMQMCRDRDARSEAEREAFDTAIEALERERTDEWCTDCKEYDTEKKCCPRFNRVIRGAMKRIPHEDGTLEVKVEDATKVGRVLISDDEHRGGLYYPDEDELQGDFDGMIFSTDKYMAFIDKKEIHIMRKGAHKITVERMFNTEGDEYKPMPNHDRDWIVGCIKHDGFVKTDRGDKANQIILDALSADRSRGEWIDEDGTYYANCSKCGYQIDTHEERGYHNFCPNCGAVMRGEDE